MAYNAEMMTVEFEKFEKEYSFPVYVSVIDLTGFFASNTNLRYGYAALTEHSIILAYMTPLGAMFNEYIYKEIPKFTINSLKIKKALLWNTHTIDIKGAVGKKKYRYKITVVEKIAGGNFPDQPENSAQFIETLREWSSELY